jgi:hypothetical protein
MKKAAVKKKIAIEEVSYEKSAAASHKAEEIR